jgi:prolyl-tRNA editing enzyme YbaK/EbsC (Cys-tRNA(Pro) deacylase)
MTDDATLDGNPDLRRAIHALLDGHGIPYREVRHEPTRTSAESAAARGEPMEIGGKALVVKVDDTFAVFVLSAVRELSSRGIRRGLGARRTRFASRAELHAMTGLVPGCVPPFGRPILPFDLYVDPSIVANDRIAFNAASLTHSIVLDRADWQRVANPTGVFAFSRDGASTDGA